jgi:hypothetical protein
MIVLENENFGMPTIHAEACTNDISYTTAKVFHQLYSSA